MQPLLSIEFVGVTLRRPQNCDSAVAGQAEPDVGVVNELLPVGDFISW
jgi:hypothetical protein